MNRVSRFVVCLYSPRHSRSIAAAVGATALAVLACAPVSASAADGSSRLAKEHHACAVVLGLDPTEAPYQACITNLDQSLAAANPSQLADGTAGSLDAARDKAPQACVAVGLKPGTPAYDDCVTDLKESLSDEDMLYR